MCSLFRYTLGLSPNSRRSPGVMLIRENAMVRGRFDGTVKVHSAGKSFAKLGYRLHLHLDECSCSW